MNFEGQLNAVASQSQSPTRILHTLVAVERLLRPHENGRIILFETGERAPLNPSSFSQSSRQTASGGRSQPQTVPLFSPISVGNVKRWSRFAFTICRQNGSIGGQNGAAFKRCCIWHTETDDRLRWRGAACPVPVRDRCKKIPRCWGRMQLKKRKTLIFFAPVCSFTRHWLRDHLLTSS